MRTIKCGVRCEFWDHPKEFEVQVPEEAPEDQIETEILCAAIDAAKFEVWREDE